MLDFAQRLTRGISGFGSFNHALGAALHRYRRVLSIGLDALDDGADMLGRFRRALRETLHLLRDNGETAACFPRGRRLDRSIQREHVGLLGDARYQLHDLADLLRAFAQALDAFRCFLDLFAYIVHATDCVLHRLCAFFCGIERVFRYLRGLGCVARHLVDRLRHL